MKILLFFSCWSNVLNVLINCRKQKEKTNEVVIDRSQCDVDPILLAHFAAWRTDPVLVREGSEFLQQMYMEEIDPCLTFANEPLVIRLRKAIEDNSIWVEPLSEKDRPNVAKYAYRKIINFSINNVEISKKLWVLRWLSELQRLCSSLLSTNLPLPNALCLWLGWMVWHFKILQGSCKLEANIIFIWKLYCVKNYCNHCILPNRSQPCASFSTICATSKTDWSRLLWLTRTGKFSVWGSRWHLPNSASLFHNGDCFEQ